AHGGSASADFIGRSSGCVSRGNYRSRADSRNPVDRDLIFLEDPQHANVCDPAGEPASQGQANHWRRRGLRRAMVPAPAANVTPPFADPESPVGQIIQCAPSLSNELPKRSMRLFALALLPPLVLLLILAPVHAQRDLSGAAEIALQLDKLNVLGRVLMIAAHPDDENTALLAYMARGKLVRTAYLSAT